MQDTTVTQRRFSLQIYVNDLVVDQFSFIFPSGSTVMADYATMDYVCMLYVLVGHVY
jgi:hypothetical protein